MGRRRILHWSAGCLGLWLIAGLWGVASATAGDLYSAQTVVTGQGEDNRLGGFALCLEDVLIKVSGAYQLSGDVRLTPLKARAREFVTGFDYHDQMSGKPKHDEQGTRDRPYDLTVSFDHAKIDDVLGQLGVKPWLAPRPPVGATVAMTSGSRRFLVVSDDRQSDLQRDALRAAAGKRGLDVVLPTSAQAGSVDMDGAELPPSVLAASLPDAGVRLRGHLTWDDDALRWVSQWQLDAAGAQHRWRDSGVTFDDAFRRALGGVAQILSGNGEP
ncbi:conserved exported hypothetical protein [Bradyrhizobium sp. ORS 375]|uniref:DUF2066 domain-containing protein n=1 Tax=Bradyrhizobium sp. (strain ORS 375) TaxID=566679 RepID=UPI0002405D86|nr:DUF2066 domain-containing protein [Bradyrhizobium sp. ORS 375]CCD92414.1 conserved exported hypothetical protein [Bradyrhizobium sp. ORS 375]